jgi:hypothetical protein
MAENYIVTLRFTGQGQTAERSCSVCVPMASGDKSGVVAHGHELTPGAEREVLVVARLALFKVLRRLPTLPLSK